MVKFLRYGLFGRPLLRIMNGEATTLRFIIFAVFAALLIGMIFLTIYNFKLGLCVDLGFILCFGYILGLAMVGTIVVLALIFGGLEILGGGGSPSKEEKNELEYSDRYVLDELGEKARKRLTDAEYSRMEWEAKNTITDKQTLENFVNRWTREIDNSPIKTDENE